MKYTKPNATQVENEFRKAFKEHSNEMIDLIEVKSVEFSKISSTIIIHRAIRYGYSNNLKHLQESCELNKLKWRNHFYKKCIEYKNKGQDIKQIEQWILTCKK